MLRELNKILMKDTQSCMTIWKNLFRNKKVYMHWKMCHFSGHFETIYWTKPILKLLNIGVLCLVLVVLSVLSNFAIISLRKRELVVLLRLAVSVLCLFLMMAWICGL